MPYLPNLVIFAGLCDDPTKMVKKWPLLESTIALWKRKKKCLPGYFYSNVSSAFSSFRYQNCKLSLKHESQIYHFAQNLPYKNAWNQNCMYKYCKFTILRNSDAKLRSISPHHKAISHDADVSSFSLTIRGKVKAKNTIRQSKSITGDYSSRQY